MLVEELQAYFVAQPSGYDAPATFYLTINRSRTGSVWHWTAGYQDYDTGRILIGINHCESLEEVAIRLSGRLERYIRMHAPKPRTLHELPKAPENAMLFSTNVTEKTSMATEEQDQRKMTLGEQIQDHIKKSNAQIKYLEGTEQESKPPVVQELVLARRHLEDANNRLKKAYNLLPDDQK